jgi:hypothetical protein
MIKFINNISDLRTIFTDISKLNLSLGYVLNFELKKKIRSIPQNKKYWLVLTAIEQETGNDKNDLHEFFKDKYLKKQLIECFNTQILKIPTTTKLNTSEFSQYLEKITIFAATELNFTIPEESDDSFSQFVEYYSQYL